MTALRANTGKPELSYLLSFVGGIDFAFGESAFYGALLLLQEWYRAESARDVDGMDRLYEAAHCLLHECGEDWPEQLAKVSKYGASKYARGNFLAGMSWSTVLDCTLRHIRKIDRGEEIDPESGCSHRGAVAWNVCYLVHCVEMFPEHDDRLRAPVPAPSAQLPLDLSDEALLRGQRFQPGTLPSDAFAVDPACISVKIDGVTYKTRGSAEMTPGVPIPGLPADQDVPRWFEFRNSFRVEFNPHAGLYTIGNTQQGYKAESEDLAVCMAALGEGLTHHVRDAEGQLHVLRDPGTL